MPLQHSEHLFRVGSGPAQFSNSAPHPDNMLADWVLTAAPGFERGQEDSHDVLAQLPCMEEVNVSLRGQASCLLIISVAGLSKSAAAVVQHRPLASVCFCFVSCVVQRCRKTLLLQECLLHGSQLLFTTPPPNFPCLGLRYGRPGSSRGGCNLRPKLARGHQGGSSVARGHRT